MEIKSRRLKRVTCRECGSKYESKALRCPDCETPNPLSPCGEPHKHDWLIGTILIIAGTITGIVLVIAFVMNIMFALRGSIGAIKGLAACIVCTVFPVGCLFHGILLVCGFNPKDFYSWWENRGHLERRLAWGVLAFMIIIFLACMFGDSFSTPPPPDMNFVDD